MFTVLWQIIHTFDCIPSNQQYCIGPLSLTERINCLHNKRNIKIVQTAKTNYSRHHSMKTFCDTWNASMASFHVIFCALQKHRGGSSYHSQILASKNAWLRAVFHASTEGKTKSCITGWGNQQQKTQTKSPETNKPPLKESKQGNPAMTTKGGQGGELL